MFLQVGLYQYARLKFHMLHSICCTKLQNHLLLLTENQIDPYMDFKFSLIYNLMLGAYVRKLINDAYFPWTRSLHEQHYTTMLNHIHVCFPQIVHWIGSSHISLTCPTCTLLECSWPFSLIRFTQTMWNIIIGHALPFEYHHHHNLYLSISTNINIIVFLLLGL